MKTILLNRFEMAFRSTLAIHISKFIYWFLKDFSSDTVENRLLKQIHAITTKRSGSQPISKFKNTFEVFEFFSLGNLQRIAQNHWSSISHIFKGQKYYQNKELPIA